MLTSVKMSLHPDGSGFLANSIRIHWELADEFTIKITYGPSTELLKVLPAWDYEAWKPALVLTGTDNHHICVWGKKYE